LKQVAALLRKLRLITDGTGTNAASVLLATAPQASHVHIFGVGTLQSQYGAKEKADRASLFAERVDDNLSYLC
jgi:hypothetical protein